MATKQNQFVEKQRKIVNARQSKISKSGINPQPSSSAHINEQGPSENTMIIDKGNLDESLKINELASLENIQKVIKDEGLVYNNDKIKNID